MFIDCTSNSEDHFEITSAAVYSSLTLSQPITQGCLHGGRKILEGGTTFLWVYLQKFRSVQFSNRTIQRHFCVVCMSLRRETAQQTEQLTLCQDLPTPQLGRFQCQGQAQRFVTENVQKHMAPHDPPSQIFLVLTIFFPPCKQPLREDSQSQIETCSKVLSVKTALILLNL